VHWLHKPQTRLHTTPPLHHAVKPTAAPTARTQRNRLAAQQQHDILALVTGPGPAASSSKTPRSNRRLGRRRATTQAWEFESAFTDDHTRAGPTFHRRERSSADEVNLEDRRTSEGGLRRQHGRRLDRSTKGYVMRCPHMHLVLVRKLYAIAYVHMWHDHWFLQLRLHDQLLLGCDRSFWSQGRS
jgi:hypothetical protein